MHIFDPQSGKVTEQLKHDPANQGSLSGDAISAIYPSDDGIIWVGMANTGIDVLDRRGAQFATYSSSGLENNQVTAIYQSQAGMIWLGTKAGLLQLDPNTGQVSSYQLHQDESFIPPPRAANITGIYQDRRGQLWVDGIDGLYLLDDKSGKSTRYTPDGKPLGISGHGCRSGWRPLAGRRRSTLSLRHSNQAVHIL